MLRRRHLLAGVLAVVSVSIACAALANNPRDPLPRGTRIDRLVVVKSQHRLEAWDGDHLVRVYPVRVGSGGGGPKVYEGDAHTPEGRYRIDSRHRSREFGWFLHVSYPNADDRARHREARSRGEVPEGAGIGGDIGIHGPPRGLGALVIALGVDWTAGCIAVEDDASASELFEHVRDDAEIEIRP